MSVNIWDGKKADKLIKAIEDLPNATQAAADEATGAAADARAAIASLGGIVAPSFSSAEAYEAGDYVYKDAKLYVFTENHAPGDWDSGEVEEAQIGTDVTGLKNAISQETYIGANGFTAKSGEYHSAKQDRVDLSVRAGESIRVFVKQTKNLEYSLNAYHKDGTYTTLILESTKNYDYYAGTAAKDIIFFGVYVPTPSVNGSFYIAAAKQEEGIEAMNAIGLQRLFFTGSFAFAGETKEFTAETSGTYQSAVEKIANVKAGEKYTLAFTEVKNAASDVVASLEAYDSSDNRLSQVLITSWEKKGTISLPTYTSYLNVVYRLSFDTAITSGTVVTYKGCSLFKGEELDINETIIKERPLLNRVFVGRLLKGTLNSTTGKYEGYNSSRKVLIDFASFESGFTVIVPNGFNVGVFWYSSSSEDDFVDKAYHGNTTVHYAPEDTAGKYYRFTIIKSAGTAITEEELKTIFINYREENSHTFEEIGSSVSELFELNNEIYATYIEPLSDDIEKSKMFDESVFSDSNVEAKIESALSTVERKKFLMLAWFSDLHRRPYLLDGNDNVYETKDEVFYNTVELMKYIRKRLPIHATLDTGDIILGGEPYSSFTAAKNFEIEAEYIRSFNEASYKYLFTPGNHDGYDANSVNCQDLNYQIGCSFLDERVPTKQAWNMWYYIDFPDISTRFIVLAIPDGYTNFLGIGEPQLNWLIETALGTCPDSYGVLFAYHISTVHLSYLEANGGFDNRESFIGIVNAFHDHTTYSDELVSCDFSGKHGTKVIACLCGHLHKDSTGIPGEPFPDDASRTDPDEHLTEELPCKEIITDAAFRKAVNILIYVPSENKIYMKRIGTGSDREIEVN